MSGTSILRHCGRFDTSPHQIHDAIFKEARDVFRRFQPPAFFWERAGERQEQEVARFLAPLPDFSRTCDAAAAAIREHFASMSSQRREPHILWTSGRGRRTIIRRTDVVMRPWHKCSGCRGAFTDVARSVAQVNGRDQRGGIRLNRFAQADRGAGAIGAGAFALAQTWGAASSKDGKSDATGLSRTVPALNEGPYSATARAVTPMFWGARIATWRAVSATKFLRPAFISSIRAVGVEVSETF